MFIKGTTAGGYPKVALCVLPTPRGGSETLCMAMEQRSRQQERAWWDSVRMLKCCRLNRGLWTSQELQHTVSLVLPSMRLLHLAEEARPRNTMTKNVMPLGIP